MSNQKYYWKALRHGNGKLFSDYDRSEWTIGVERKVDPPEEECVGLNCSPTIPEAVAYVQGKAIAKVTIGGKIISGNDKLTCERMTVIEAWECDCSGIVDEYSAKRKPIARSFHKKLVKRLKDMEKIA